MNNDKEKKREGGCMTKTAAPLVQVEVFGDKTLDHVGSLYVGISLEHSSRQSFLKPKVAAHMRKKSQRLEEALQRDNMDTAGEPLDMLVYRHVTASAGPAFSSARPGDCFLSTRNANRRRRLPSRFDSANASKIRGSEPSLDSSNKQLSVREELRRKEHETTRTTISLGGSEEKRKQPWSCIACTFVNENPLHLSCSICATQREKRSMETQLHHDQFTTSKKDDTLRRDIQPAEAVLSKFKEIEEECLVTLNAERAPELIKLQQELLDECNVLITYSRHGVATST